MFVESKVYDQFVEQSKALAEKRVLGNPFDLSTEQGPQIDAGQMQKILHYIEVGKKDGAKLVTGGKQFGKQGAAGSDGPI